jgi:hypothetical protein
VLRLWLFSLVGKEAREIAPALQTGVLSKEECEVISYYTHQFHDKTLPI